MEGPALPRARLAIDGEESLKPTKISRPSQQSDALFHYRLQYGAARHASSFSSRCRSEVASSHSS